LITREKLRYLVNIGNFFCTAMH